QAARRNRFCPLMTAPVRIWPQEFAKTSSALGRQERFLSVVGQRAVLVRWQRGRRPGAPRLAILRAPRETWATANAIGGGLFRASPPLPQSLPALPKKRCLELSSLNKCWSFERPKVPDTFFWAKPSLPEIRGLRGKRRALRPGAQG